MSLFHFFCGFVRQVPQSMAVANSIPALKSFLVMPVEFFTKQKET